MGERKESVEERARYRLRGTVGEVERAFIVPPTGGTIGSARENAIVVAVRGVSRQHARLAYDEDGLVVEDLGSKNGTLVNEVPVERSALGPGDRLQLGPVHFVLEAVDPGDAEVGLAVGGVPIPPLPVAGTTSRLGPVPAAWVELVEDFAVRLWGRSKVDFGAAVARAVAAIGARAGALVEWEGAGRPAVVAAAGRLGALPEITVLQEHQERGTLWVAEKSMVTGYVGLADSGRCGLVLWGIAEPDGSMGAVLRLMAGLAALARGRALATDRSASGAPRRLRFPDGYLPGRSPVMISIYEQLAALASGDIPVLLTGETGVGKEPLARALHDSSVRRSGPFIAVNCAAIAGDQLEAELFGVGQGAATGVAARLGLFREAHGGSLFLDEVGELPTDLQAKLLRVLQEREVRPIGAPPVRVDVRLVSATNRDLLQQIERGAFRSDLYYRLAGAALAVPPLRQRREDLPGLIGHFVQTLAMQLSKPVRGISTKALRLLEAHPWPGNVRQLENELRRAVLACPDDALVDSGMLSHEIQQPRADQGLPMLEPGVQPLMEQLKDVERYILHRALEGSGGNKSQAAKQLGISRNGLAYRLKRLGMEG